MVALCNNVEIMNCAARSLSWALLLVISPGAHALAFGPSFTILAAGAPASTVQYSIIAGEYSGISNHIGYGRLSLLVAKGKTKNWTVKGTLEKSQKRGTILFSGTLYDSGKLALTQNKPDKIPLSINGSFDASQGILLADLAYGKVEIALFHCKNTRTQLDAKFKWVLKDGFPKLDEAYTKSPKPFTVDAGGKVIWPATSLQDGKPISQTLSFTPPKREYMHGEKWLVSVDASSTVKGAYPFVLAIMYFGWRSGGWIGTGNDKSAHNELTKYKAEGEVIFNPSSEEQAAILVGSPGMGGLRWEYRRAPATGPIPPDPSIGLNEDITGIKSHPSGTVSLVRNSQRIPATGQTIRFIDIFETGADGTLRASKDESDLFRLNQDSRVRVEGIGKDSPQLTLNLERGSIDCFGPNVNVRVGFGTVIMPGGSCQVFFDGKTARLQVLTGQAVVEVNYQPMVIKAGESWTRVFG